VVGLELNPSLIGIDLKTWAIRPGLIGWILINFSVAAKQYEITGTLANSMVLAQLFALTYAINHFFLFESVYLQTWDIISENFGLMLVWGDLVWIPFGFAIQPWYLLANPIDLNILEICLFSIFFCIWVLGISTI